LNERQDLEWTCHSIDIDVDALPGTCQHGSFRRFEHPGGYLEFDGLGWTETSKTVPSYRVRFEEFSRASDYIFLVDKSRTSGSSENYYQLRVPIEGGEAQWSYINPIQWTGLYLVKPVG
jgi:hypothetical protein